MDARIRSLNISYGISILSVGQSLMFLIFKKLSDDDEGIFIVAEHDGNADIALIPMTAKHRQR